MAASAQGPDTVVSPDSTEPGIRVDLVTALDCALGFVDAINTADVVLAVRDNATITRNKEAVLAQSYAQSKRAMGTSEATLNREIKSRSRELVQELLAGLSDRHRRLLNLEAQGLTRAEIATELGYASADAVTQTLRRLRRDLRERLAAREIRRSDLFPASKPNRLARRRHRPQAGNEID